MIKNLPQSTLQQIVDFAVDNYEDSSYEIPQNTEELLKMYGEHDYFATHDEHGIEALCFVDIRYTYVAEVSSAIVRLDLREQQLTAGLGEVVENTLLSQGVKKLIAYIHTKNKTSLITAISRDFIVEGLLRNQDGKGTDYYVVGKEL